MQVSAAGLLAVSRSVGFDLLDELWKVCWIAIPRASAVIAETRSPERDVVVTMSADMVALLTMHPRRSIVRSFAWLGIICVAVSGAILLWTYRSTKPPIAAVYTQVLIILTVVVGALPAAIGIMDTFGGRFAISLSFVLSIYVLTRVIRQSRG
jgi:hypothetical protein